MPFEGTSQPARSPLDGGKRDAYDCVSQAAKLELSKRKKPGLHPGLFAFWAGLLARGAGVPRWIPPHPLWLGSSGCPANAWFAAGV